MPVAAPQHRRLATESSLLPESEASAARGSMLEAALRLIAERGYGGTSVRDIAAACGVQPATLYAHFPSKEHVLAELCRIGHDQFMSSLREAVLASSGDPRAQMRAFVQAQVQFHATYAMLAVVCNSELHMLSPELGASSLALRRNAEELLMSIVRRGIEQKAFVVEHPWLAMAYVGGAGLRVANWFTPDFELSAEQVADIYATQALRALGAVPETAV